MTFQPVSPCWSVVGSHTYILRNVHYIMLVMVLRSPTSRLTALHSLYWSMCQCGHTCSDVEIAKGGPGHSASVCKGMSAPAAILVGRVDEFS